MSSESNGSVERLVAAAVITDKDRVLLVRRRVAEGTLLWAFPSGGVEDGETPSQAAVRETAEEVGLTVTAGIVLGERVHPATGRRMVYVACDVVSGSAVVADTDELDAVEWVTVRDLAGYVPGGVFPPVQEHLTALAGGGSRGQVPG